MTREIVGFMYAYKAGKVCFVVRASGQRSIVGCTREGPWSDEKHDVALRLWLRAVCNNE